jgi:hypothetical protein
MVQVLKSAQDFELFGGLSPGRVRVRTYKFKSHTDFGQMRHFQPRNCRFEVYRRGRLHVSYRFSCRSNT